MSLWSPFDDAEDAAEYHFEQRLNRFTPCPCNAGLSTMYCKVCHTHACWGCLHEHHSHLAMQCAGCEQTVLHVRGNIYVDHQGGTFCLRSVSGVHGLEAVVLPENKNIA